MSPTAKQQHLTDALLESAWLVFTDLDGTLLDHQNYSHAAAQPALQRLAAQRVPVILVSSKTRAELAAIRTALQLCAPLIAENGAFIDYPAHWPAPPLSKHPEPRSPGYAELRRLLTQLRQDRQLKFTGFGDLDTAGIAALTGLTPQQAALARQREASEPIRWQDSEQALQLFRTQLQNRGLQLLAGGRFEHVMGQQADKAHAATEVIDSLRQQGWQGQVIALGDAPNDHGLLSIADYPVIVRNPLSPPMPGIDNPRLLRTQLNGPAGWCKAIEQILDGPRQPRQQPTRAMRTPSQGTST